ncbi:alpha/beta hydrolase [Aliiglaciecola sp. LCG003]|uniref:alpha/beta fold hydrolase n=1 Tax=Aliiglaciecola sp. LCG003 TaxID=3053655 RepID=UPI002572EB10|nr:alpha/beta hydrolase [Aliiglaciecola sp. LCG003]WJG09560.1 alpha/beta hydrolase [Aliiglaciecola sp. LCG003]
MGTDQLKITKHVVLISGLMCNAKFWAEQIPALSENFLIYCPNLANFDRFDAMAKSILDQQPASFHLIGHSMGARVALEVMRLAPDRVLSLALFDTGVHGVADNEPQKRQILLDIANTSGMQAVAGTWIPQMLHPNRRDDKALLKRIEAMVLDYSPQQFHNQVAALLHRQPAYDVLKTLSCPTLVGCGRQDQWSTLAQHQAFCQYIHNPQFSVIEDCGHMVAMEQPKVFLTILLNWLEVQNQ